MKLNKSFQLIKIFIFVLLIILSFSLYCQEVVVYDVSVNEDDVVIDDITGEDGITYSKVSLKGGFTAHEAGQPGLPVLNARLIVPSDLGVTAITLDNPGPGRTLTLSSPVYPAQAPIPLYYKLNDPLSGRPFPTPPPFAGPDPEVYETNNAWPPDMVKLVNSGYIDGNIQIVYLEVTPFQLYAEEMKLEIYTDITLSIEMGGQSRIQPISRSMRMANAETILEKIVDNDSDIQKYMDSASATPAPITNTQELPYYDYVIITDNTFKNFFNDLICWKTRLGFKTGVVTCQEIYAAYPGGDQITGLGIDDNAGSIRQYLYDAWLNGTDFALLVGDHNKVPVRYGWGTIISNDDDDEVDFFNKIPTDLYYADLNGDWNVDDDPYYGEPKDPNGKTGDDVDYFPEIRVGRIPVGPLDSNNSDQTTECKTYIDNWIEKVIYYEKGNFVTAASNTYPANMFWLRGPMYPPIPTPPPPDFFTLTIWDYPPGYQGDDIVEEMSKGYGFVALHNLGRDIDFFTDDTLPQRSNFVSTFDSYRPIVDGDGLDNMTNKSLYSIAYAYFGFAGAHDHALHAEPYASLAEGWTHLFPERCGTGILTNTRYTYYRYGGINLEENFFNIIDIGHTYDFLNLKEFLRISFADQISKLVPALSDHYTQLSHNAFCCPEEMLWTKNPDLISVTIADGTTHVDVSVTGDPADICVSTCYDNGESYHELAPTTNYHRFNTTLQDLFVTVSRSNDKPYLATIRSTGATGDVNGDGDVNILDALLIVQYYVGLPVQIDEDEADVNCDGYIDIVDALLIAQYYVGLIDSFPCCLC